MHIHLDPIGGIAGDMFIAAILDCFPEFIKLVESVPEALGIADKLSVTSRPHNNGVLTGRRFSADDISHAEHAHPHTSFRKIKADIERSKLPDAVKKRAVDIFHILAVAEAKVHGVEIEEVSFHEVGALDSIADIVSAGYLIEALAPCEWSIAPIPMGAGRVMTQHGMLPVPVPATVNLLEGFYVFQDGVNGERVTPTGAAIVKYLSPQSDGKLNNIVLDRSGTGFGTKQFDEFPNILRIMVFNTATKNLSDTVTVFEFEVDDQTPEDLAIGLEHIRDVQGVLDVTLCPIMSKKGRQAQRIQLLGEMGADRRILDACFEQTTTIGVRFHQCLRETLRRDLKVIDGIGVKVVQRPSGPSGKPESDDLAGRHKTAHKRTKAGHLASEKALGGGDE